MAEPDDVVRELPSRRRLFLDERGVGLRATWHPERGIVNLSVWRGDRCQETFHLRLADVPSLIGLLADGLGDAATGAAPRRSVLPGDDGTAATPAAG